MPLVWSGKCFVLLVLVCPVFGPVLTTCFCSAARDQLTGSPVAVKKIMKPFSTPVLSKRTYRELKLLKHLRHENVGCLSFAVLPGLGLTWNPDHLSKRHLHFPAGGYVRANPPLFSPALQRDTGGKIRVLTVTATLSRNSWEPIFIDY